MQCQGYEGYKKVFYKNYNKQTLPQYGLYNSQTEILTEKGNKWVFFNDGGGGLQLDFPLINNNNYKGKNTDKVSIFSH